MSPHTIEQLHRMEGKIDTILEFLRLKYEFVPPKLNEERVCPLCSEIINYHIDREGEVIRKCTCTIDKKSLDFNTFGPPK